MLYGVIGFQLVIILWLTWRNQRLLQYVCFWRAKAKYAESQWSEVVRSEREMFQEVLQEAKVIDELATRLRETEL